MHLCFINKCKFILKRLSNIKEIKNYMEKIKYATFHQPYLLIFLRFTQVFFASLLENHFLP